jgi:hypothetical protein
MERVIPHRFAFDQFLGFSGSSGPSNSTRESLTSIINFDPTGSTGSPFSSSCDRTSLAGSIGIFPFSASRISSTVAVEAEENGVSVAVGCLASISLAVRRLKSMRLRQCPDDHGIEYSILMMLDLEKINDPRECLRLESGRVELDLKLRGRIYGN